MKEPLVSVIVPTYNSSEFLEACLQSIKDQTYKNIELIVVDNNSTDNTKEIANKFTKNVFNKGPERSAQRNYGANKSSGEYVAIIDSDMELTEKVIESCVSKAMKTKNLAGIIIPEESFGKSFWAQCKKLERSFYIGIDWIEAARFYPKELYEKLGGYNEDMISGEDWDLSQRATENGKLARTDQFIMHNEGDLKLSKLLKKKYYYAQKVSLYTNTSKSTNRWNQTSPLSRLSLYLSKPRKLLNNILYSLGMLTMRALEMSAGILGIISARIGSHKENVSIAQCNKKLPVVTILEEIDFNNSCLLGYYGGGNYGDELLLEILQNTIHKRSANVTILYRDISTFSTYHHDFGFRVVDQSNTARTLGTLFKSRNIIIGGGGIWGMDANTRVLALGILLFFLRIIGKKVYLVGVGYYSSTNKRGRVSAFFAAKSAALIGARDVESYKLFSRMSQKTYLSDDISAAIPCLDLTKYEAEAKKIERNLKLPSGPITYITFRKFESNKGERYEKSITELIKRRVDVRFLLSIFQPAKDCPECVQLIQRLNEEPNVFVMDAQINPLTIFSFFHNNKDRLKLIAPQYHAIITAIQNNIPFVPIAYDNKVVQLLNSVNASNIINVSEIRWDLINEAIFET